MGLDTKHPKRDQARQGLLVYFIVLIVGSSYLEWRIIEKGDAVGESPALIFALMYMPALASFVARALLREGTKDISLRAGGKAGLRAVFVGWTYPIVVGFLAYGIAWLTGLAEFQAPLQPRSHLYSAFPIRNLMTSLLFTATAGTVLSCVSAFGEEVGWRGYMLTRLISSGMRAPVFFSGLIWAMWHIPLILSGQYAAGTDRWRSALIFIVGTVVMGFLLAYLRLLSGSVWPAVVLHGAWNAVIQGTFDRATQGTPAAVGESGWLVLVFSALFVAIVTRAAWLTRQTAVEKLLPT